MLRASAALSAALLAAAQAQPLPSPSSGPRTAAFVMTSFYAVPGCSGPPNSITAEAITSTPGICPGVPSRWPAGCSPSNPPANTTSEFRGNCSAAVPQAQAAVAASVVAPFTAAVPGTLVYSIFEQPSCSYPNPANPVVSYNVTQLGVCSNATMTITTCIGSSALVSYYNDSACSSLLPYTTQLWSMGCQAQKAPFSGSVFISGCQTARGSGLTYNPVTNAANVQAALIAPLVLGSLVLCVSGALRERAITKRKGERLTPRPSLPSLATDDRHRVLPPQGRRRRRWREARRGRGGRRRARVDAADAAAAAAEDRARVGRRARVAREERERRSGVWRSLKRENERQFHRARRLSPSRGGQR